MKQKLISIQIQKSENGFIIQLIALKESFDGKCINSPIEEYVCEDFICVKSMLDELEPKMKTIATCVTESDK